MSDYTIETLNGLLTQVQSCGELLEAVIPLAVRLLTEVLDTRRHGCSSSPRTAKMACDVRAGND